MHFSHEHQQIFDTTKRFVAEEINPHVRQWEEDGVWPAHEVLKQMGDLGLLGISKPEKVGGLGLDYSYSMLFAEALGHCSCGGIPMAIGVHTDMATPALTRYGSDYLHQEFLAPAVAGEQVASVSISEPGAGSDVAGIKTTARRVGDDFIINGQKMWITNGTQADWTCLLANTGEAADDGRHGNKSLIMVPLDSKGVQRDQKLDKLGQRASDTAIIYFDDVRVPVRNLVGEQGKGFIYQMQQFQEERIFLSASILAAMDRCVEETAEYAGQRKAFGGRILENQYVHFSLAELATEIEAARALTYRAVEKMLEGEDVTLMASMAKLKTARLARQVADICLQFWGGQGYVWDNQISQFYRDLRLHSIGGGADEIMLSIIAKRLGMAPG